MPPHFVSNVTATTAGIETEHSVYQDQNHDPHFGFPRGLAVLLIGTLAACGEPSAARQISPASAPLAEAATTGQKTGTITGMVGTQGGEWSTLSVTDGSVTHATANFSSLSGTMTDFSLQGHRAQQVQILGAVTIEFTMMDQRLVESGVKYFPEQSTFPFYGDHEGSVKVTIDQIEIDGDIATVSGQAFGEVYRVVDFRSDPDLADARHVDLRFDVTAHRQ